MGVIAAAADLTAWDTLVVQEDRMCCKDGPGRRWWDRTRATASSSFIRRARRERFCAQGAGRSHGGTREAIVVQWRNKSRFTGQLAFSFIHAARLQHRAFHGQSTSMSCDDLVTSLRRQKNRIWTATTAKFFSNPLNGITDLASRCGLSLEGHLPLCPKTRQDACQGISLLPNAKPVFPCSRCCCSRSPVALPAHQALSAER